MEIQKDNNFVCGFRRNIELLKLIENYNHGVTREGRFKKKYSTYTLNLIDNLFLLYNRFYPYKDSDKDKKKKFLDAAADLWNSQNKIFLDRIIQRRKEEIAEYDSNNWTIEEIPMCTDWRFIPGLGSQSVLETSINLHHLYGYPYISGSAVKGIARAYAEEIEISKSLMLKIFGSEDKRKDEAGNKKVGEVIFFDALPTADLKLDVDVMNVHYNDYYNGPGYPGDWMEPKLLFFLAIAQKQIFHFCIAAKDRKDSSNSQKLFDDAKKFLINGLSELGSGAKTSAGYGYFEEYSTDSNSDDTNDENGEIKKENKIGDELMKKNKEGYDINYAEKRLSKFIKKGK